MRHAQPRDLGRLVARVLEQHGTRAATRRSLQWSEEKMMQVLLDAEHLGLVHRCERGLIRPGPGVVPDEWWPVLDALGPDLSPREWADRIGCSVAVMTHYLRARRVEEAA